MGTEDFGVILFIVLIVAFIAYIAAAAMRDKKRRLPEPAEDPEGLPVPPGTAGSAPQEYCYSCMAKLSGGETSCPSCGKPLSLRGQPWQRTAGTTVAGRYLIGLALGESRSSVTYLARDLRLETRVRLREYYPRELAARDASGAVTVAPGSAEAFEKGKDLFLREARQLSRLNGISSAAEVKDLFEADGAACAVTEYAEGQPLTEWLAENGAVPPEYTLALFAPVLRQLEREQAMGLTRCNLSPESFSVCDGVLKLEGIGAPGGRVSTFLHDGFAPEELYRKSGEPGPWTDVYSVCAVMYRCLTGVSPDQAGDRVYRDGLRSPSSLGVYLSAAFEEALMKGLCIYRDDRFPDCAALFRAIYRNRNAASGRDSFYSPIIDPVGEAGEGTDGFAHIFQPEDHDVDAIPNS